MDSLQRDIDLAESRAGAGTEKAAARLAAVQARTFDVGPVIAAEVVVSERNVRRRLYSIVERLAERLEARILAGATTKSTEAAMAQVLLQCVDRLDDMSRRDAEDRGATGSDQVEQVLTRMADLARQIKALRTPGSMPKTVITDSAAEP